MEEFKARRVVEALRERGVPAQLERPSTYQFGVAVALPDGRLAVWGADSSASLTATVLRDGVLVGLVPTVEGSDVFSEDEVVDAIARTDYDAPVARVRREPAPAGAPLPRPSLFQWRRDGFRYRG
ncbi:MAG: hypothetical protein JWO60_2365 [Frankiales bacterium]|nr:hypothetical protein [Frankiales bacterium]